MSAALHAILFVLCVYPPLAIGLVFVLARRAGNGWRRFRAWFWSGSNQHMG